MSYKSFSAYLGGAGVGAGAAAGAAVGAAVDGGADAVGTAGSAVFSAGLVAAIPTQVDYISQHCSKLMAKLHNPQ